jgi:hypothetical protein
MVGEFFGWDENLFGDIGLRQLTVIPFSIGLILLLYYYIFLARNRSYQDKMAVRTNNINEQELHR